MKRAILSFYDVVKMQQDKQQKSVSVQRKIIDKLVRKSRMNLKELSEYHKKCHDNYTKRQINFDKNINGYAGWAGCQDGG